MAVATEANYSYFSISLFDLVNMWHEESACIFKNLIQLARSKMPAMIFIDDVDSLCGASSLDGIDRIKIELLVQIQDICVKDYGILVIGATNVPWALDAATRKMFEKRIYIPLPDEESRRHLFERKIGNSPCELNPEDLDQLAKLTEGYSEANICTVVREALMMPLHKILIPTDKFSGSNPSDSNHTHSLYMPCHSRPQDLEMMTCPGDRALVPLVKLSDFIKCIELIRPTVNEGDLKQFDKFTEEFGQAG